MESEWQKPLLQRDRQTEKLTMGELKMRKRLKVNHGSFLRPY